MPSYNDKRRGQAVLAEPRQLNLLQRCRSNPQIYYGRAKLLNGVGSGYATLSSAGGGFTQRRCDTGPRDMYYRFMSVDAGRHYYDNESVRSLSISSASSLSGERLLKKKVKIILLIFLYCHTS